MQARGGGFGRGSNRRIGGGYGPGGKCICPNCHHHEPHQQGIPCYTKKCPQCGTPLYRSD